eukprot:1155474-Pelagomonas_calceolata.AAC.4
MSTLPGVTVNACVKLYVQIPCLHDRQLSCYASKSFSVCFAQQKLMRCPELHAEGGRAALREQKSGTPCQMLLLLSSSSSSSSNAAAAINKNLVI